MIIKEKQTILERAVEIKKEIDRKKDQLRDLREGGIKSVSYGEKIHTSVNGMTASDMAIEIQSDIEDLEQDWKIEVELIKRQLERQTNLSEQEQKLLTLRYVKCLLWKEVAPLMGYTDRHCRRIKDECLLKMVL